MSTDLAELQRWLERPREDERLEFKEAKDHWGWDKLYRYGVALANEGGGKLILGVTDKTPRRIVGSRAFSNTNDLKTRVLDKLGFRVEVEELGHPDGRVVIVHIPSRPRGTAFHLDGAYLMRSGEDLLPMSEDRLRAIFDEGKPDWLSLHAQTGLSADDVVRLLDRQSYFDMLRLPYPAQRKGVIDRFERERLISREAGSLCATNLGAMLFAKQLDDFEGVGLKAPRVIVYDGTSKLKTRIDRSGTKGYASGFQGLIDFINAQIQPNEVIGRALRREVKMFPEIAIRELVANALIHQNFDMAGISVMIEIYKDRMEIVNPGEPLIPADRLIDEYQSRNERLADLMRRLGI